MKVPEINPSRVDFVTLRLFCAVARTGSITKGAELCNIATSAASRRLSDFEKSTQARLLERTPHGVSLTPAGHVAMQHAMRLFQGFEQFSSELREHSRGTRGHVRLWANISALTDFLPAALSSFLAAHPGIRVEVEEQLSVDIVSAVVDGLADIGVFAENTPAHGLETFAYRVEPLVLVCRRDHPLARRRSVDFRSCLRYDFVGSSRGSAVLELLSRAAEASGVPLRMRVQVRSFDAMCQMIAAGLGIGILPLAASRAQLAALNLRAVSVKDAWAARQLVVAVQGGRELAAAPRLLLQHLRERAAGAAKGA